MSTLTILLRRSGTLTKQPTPIITREAFTVISYIHNVASFDPSLQDLVNSTNGGAVTIDGTNYDTDMCYCAGIDVTEVLYKNDIPYRTITIRIKVASDQVDKWKRVLLNQSKRQLVGEVPDQVSKQILHPVSGQHVSSPWPLDKNGAQLELNAGQQAFTYKKWNEYKSLSWTALGLS